MNDFILIPVKTGEQKAKQITELGPYQLETRLSDSLQTAKKLVYELQEKKRYPMVSVCLKYDIMYNPT